MKNRAKIKPSLILVLIFIAFYSANAQINPTWIRKEPNIKGNFNFRVIQGAGTSLQEARTDAFNSLMNQLTASQGVSVSGQTEIQVDYSSNNGGYNEKNSQISNYTIKSGDKQIAFSIQDEFHKKGEYYFLVEIANDPQKPQFKNLVFTSNYNPLYGLPSIIIPGSGQMLKNDYKKGLKFLGAEVGLIALSATVIGIGGTESNLAVGVAYVGLFGFLGLHIWNIVDAFAAPGARRVSVYKTNRQYKNDLSLSPTSNGIGLVYSF